MSTDAPALPADLTAGLKRLKLAAMRQLAPELLVVAKTQRWKPEDFLRTLIEAEITARDASNARNRLRAAAFPVTKTLEEFDLAASSVPKASFDYLASLEWIAAKENPCFLVTVAIIPPARSQARRLGQSPQEVAAVGSPDEALGDDRVSLVVDLETAAVHEPGPGAFHDPALGECLEAARVDALDHLDADVMVPAVLDERAFEARVTPELGEATRTLACPVGRNHAAGVVRDRRGHNDNGHEEPEGVDDAEGLAPIDPLSGVISLGLLGNAGRGAHRAGIDDARRGLGLAALLGPHRRGQTRRDLFPGAVPRPLEVLTVHRVPIRIARRQRSPLTAGRGHIEDGVDDAPPVDGDGTTHRTGRPIGRDQIGDELPLLVAHITVGRAPGLGHCNGVVLHDKGYAALDLR